MRYESPLILAPLVIALTVFVEGSTALAQQQNDAQQRCIVAVNKAARTVAKAQARTNAACLRSMARDRDPVAFENCLGADARGFVQKALSKLEGIVVSRCVDAPDFGFTDAATAGGAASTQVIELFHDIFGDDLSAVTNLGASTREGVVCQHAIHDAYERILQAQLRHFDDCKKAGLKSGDVVSRASLAACLDAMTADASGAVEKAVKKLVFTWSKKCVGIQYVFAVITGQCGGIINSECVRRTCACRACQLLDAADDTGASCDVVDNGVADSSCLP